MRPPARAVGLAACSLLLLPLALLPLQVLRVIVLCDGPCEAPPGAYQLQGLGPGFIGQVSYFALAGVKGSVLIDRELPVHWEPLVHSPLQQAFNSSSPVGPTGRGVKVALLDTGVNYRLAVFGGGIGPGKPIVDGYDFVSNDADPLDADGHGTAVAYIIRQQAPGASLLVYRVGRAGEILLSALFRALDRALSEGAQVINLSLGTDQPDPALQQLMARASSQGALVVAAAGNSGPKPDTVSYPAAYGDVLAVGSSKPGLEQSVSVQLKTSRELGFTLNLLPMARAPLRNVSGPIVYASRALPSDVNSLDLNGAIVLAERGGQLPYAYFSYKERLVASKGAAALIVFNNQEGFFLGNLSDPLNPNYTPTIPVFSLDREAGLALLAALREGPLYALINIFRYAKDVSIFSSRGGGLFSIKPNVVAVGEDVQTLDAAGHPWTPSGSSFSAPQVSALAARLLEARPNMTGPEVGTLISLGTDLVRAPWGDLASPLEQGAGRPNQTKLLLGGLLANATSLVVHLSPLHTRASLSLQVKPVADSLSGASFLWLEGGINATARPSASGLSVQLSIDRAQRAQLYEGFLELRGRLFTYHIPMLVYVDNMTMAASAHNGSIAVGAVGGGSFVANITVITPSYERQTYAGVALPFSFRADQAGVYHVAVTARAANGSLYMGYADVRNQTPTSALQVDTTLLLSLALGLAFIALFTVALLEIYRERRAARPSTEGGAPSPPSASSTSAAPSP